MPAAPDQHNLFCQGGGLTEGVRQYLISILTAAMICSAARRLVGDQGTGGTMIRVITGIFLTMTVLGPLAELSLTGWDVYWGEIQIDSAWAVEEGRKRSRDALDAGIKEQVEAYIYEKARSLDAQVTVEVTNGDGNFPIPEKIVIGGRLSPYARKRLEEIIVQNLGVPKENLTWTGN